MHIRTKLALAALSLVLLTAPDRAVAKPATANPVRQALPQVPGHHIQMDVKFLTFIGKHGEKIRRFQYTAIDDATRVRALKVYDKH